MIARAIRTAGSASAGRGITDALSDFPLARHSEADPTASEVEVCEGGDAFRDAAEAWDVLEQQGGAATPFLTYAVASACAAAHMKRGAVPRIVIVKENGKPQLIFPSVITKTFGISVVRFLGDPLIQYGDALVSPDVRQGDIARALAIVAAPEVASLAIFRRVRDDAAIAPTLASVVEGASFEESPLVDLVAPSRLSSRDVREQRRQNKRLLECGTLAFEVLRSQEAKPALRLALELKRDWLTAHGHQSAVLGSADWEEAINAICLAPKSPMVVALLTCGGKPAAIEVALVNDSCWFSFLGAFAPEYSRFGAGSVLTDHCMRWARDQGLSQFDQLPPAQQYKRRQASHSVGVRDYALPLRLTGNLPLTIGLMAPSAKWFLSKMPESARSALLKAAGY